MPGKRSVSSRGLSGSKRKSGSWIPAAAVVVALLAPSGLRGEEPEYFQQGRMFLKEGRTEEAIGAFERNLSRNPRHIETVLQLALIHSRHVSSYGKSEAEFLLIPEIAVDLPGRIRDDFIFRAGLHLGKLYIRSGQYRKAIHVLEGTIASAPSETSVDEAYNNLALAYYHERLYDKAILMFRNALKANPENKEAKFNLRMFQARHVHYRVGEIYSRIGDPESAIEALSRAVRIDPRYIEARMKLASELVRAGRNHEALAEFFRAERFSRHFTKNHEIWYGQGLAMAAVGRKAEAMELFRKAAGANPRFAKPHNELGKIRLEEGDFAEAAQSFAIAIQIDPRAEYVQNLQAAIRKLR